MICSVRAQPVADSIYACTCLHWRTPASRSPLAQFLFSLDGLDRFTKNHKCANPTLPTKDGEFGSGELTPLQLAVAFGDDKMSEFMIHERSIVQWQWGPLVSLAIPLDEIDSAGPSPSDVMQILDLTTSKPKTHEMVLDTFMDGFLFNLFNRKWQLFAKRTLIMLVALDILTFVPLVIVGMEIRKDREDRTWWLPYWVMTGAAIQVGLDTVATLSWLSENDGIRGLCLKRTRLQLFSWMRRNGLPQNFIVFAATITSCVIAIAKGDDEGKLKVIQRILLAFAVYLDVIGLMGNIFLPFQRLGVFQLVVDQLLATDLPTFMIFLWGYAFTFVSTLYIAYPADHGIELDVSPAFNHPLTAVKAMIDLSITGEKFPLELGEEWGHDDKWINLVVFAFFYYMCMIMIVVLLMRLFMALLSATYNSIKQSATLEWRLQFLRWVLYAELLQPSFMGPTWSGELVNGQWAYILQEPSRRDAKKPVEASAEGGQAGSFRKPGGGGAALSTRGALSTFADKVEHIKQQLRLEAKGTAAKALSQANLQLGLRPTGTLAKQAEAVLSQLDPAGAPASAPANSSAKPSRAPTPPPTPPSTQAAPSIKADAEIGSVAPAPVDSANKTPVPEKERPPPQAGSKSAPELEPEPAPELEPEPESEPELVVGPSTALEQEPAPAPAPETPPAPESAKPLSPASKAAKRRMEKFDSKRR